MKDRQIRNQGPQPGIPVISPVLHCLSMPAIVYLRSSFGFAYLSPKSVFIAFAWAMILFAVYAWQEPGQWQQFGGVVVFGVGAVILYSGHLLKAFVWEIRHKGEHDFFSGRSHFSRLPIVGKSNSTETIIRLWIEPFIVCAFALFGGSRWLLAIGGALWFKEFINFWYNLRQGKKQEDVFDDATESLGRKSDSPTSTMPMATGRKERQHRARISHATSEHDERRHAERLCLMPPYTLKQAEANHRLLVGQVHPDLNQSSDESNQQTAPLDEALNYFRKKFAG